MYEVHIMILYLCSLLTNTYDIINRKFQQVVASHEIAISTSFQKGVTSLKPEDIPVTLVYCNQLTVAEDAADHLCDWAGGCGIAPNCIAFYHSKVGQKWKQELEEKL